ncbi:MAG: PHP domain-containing protein [Acetivibrionales bacterium]|jgi:predicted metal-dependent phosphoesterase TrpH
MRKTIDLHTHSTASDGTLTPRQLVRHAKECGLSAIALTDHDTIDGIEDALDEAALIGFEVIPGIEISVDYQTEMHILGYFFDNDYLNVEPALDELRRSREERNPKIVNNLNRLGFSISMEEVKKEAQGEIVARPHIASVLYKKGYVKSIREAFDKYLSVGKPAYCQRKKLAPEKGLKLISEAGGIPVLAHPIYLHLGYNQLDSLIYKLKKAGLAGIEAYYSDNSKEDTRKLLKLAQKHELLVTGGSDFHGDFKTDIRIGTGRGGLCIPYELLEKLKS